MSNLKGRLQAAVRHPHAMTAAGLALAASGLVIHMAVTVPLRSELAQFQQRLVAAKVEAETAARSQRRSDVAPLSARLEEFYGYFPTRQNTPDGLQKIYAAAASQGVQLAQGEYRLMPDKTGKLVGYQIGFPVRGRYAQLRKFVVQVLAELPAASLDELSFKREAVASTDVEARIRFTLYMRAQQ